MPSDVAEKEVALAGEFNDWNPEATKLKKKKDVFEAELRLKPNKEYKFKYLIDGKFWENDYAADAYVPNEFGTEDSVVVVGK